MNLSKIKTATLALMCAFAISSCGDQVKKEDSKKGDKKETTDNTPTEEETNSEETKVADTDTDTDAEAQFKKDWEGIKAAILAKDIPGLGAYAGSDEVDSEALIAAASSDFVIQVLKTIEYQYLQKEDQKDGTYYVFHAYEQMNDDPKKTIYVYMKKGDNGLTVEYYTTENM